MTDLEDLARLVASRLRSARQRTGISQSEVAARLGVRPNTVSGWETAKRSPRATDLRQLCELYDCSSDHLLGFGEETREPSVWIDETRVRRILESTCSEDIEAAIDWEPEMVPFWQHVGHGSKPGSMRQVQSLSLRILHHVQTVAPDVWTRYQLGIESMRHRCDVPRPQPAVSSLSQA